MINMRILLTIISYFFAYLSVAADVSNNDLHLVVGSTGEAEDVSWWWTRMQGKGTDFSHNKTFNGQAITLNVKSSKTRSQHIMADATIFKPDENKRISDLFFELFPSGDPGPQAHIKNGSEDLLAALSLMPRAIENLSQYMNKGARLAIEHIPHLTRFEKDNYAKGFKILKSANPFHCFLSPYYLNALETRNMNVDKNPNEIKQYWDKIMAKEGAEYREAILEAAASQPHIKHAITYITEWSNFTPEEIEKGIQLEIARAKKKGVLAFIEKDGHTSLIMTIALMTSFLSQQKEVTSFLEENGFKDILITIKDESPNGRKHVLWIEAVHK